MEVLQLFPRRADEHVAHEQGMVGSGTDDSDTDSVFLIPAGITINNVDSRSGVQVVNCTFAVDLPHLDRK